MEEPLAYLLSDKSDKKNRNSVELTLALSKVGDIARSDGLTPDHIISLLDVAASGKFAVSTSSKLVKSLLPRTSIPEEAALRCLSWLCTGKPAPSLQVTMMKWLVMTFDLLESSGKMHKLYGVVFNFIENDALCPHACHLLYKLTRKEDVVLFRVKRLLKIQKTVGAQPHLMGLLKLYKVYAPHLVSLSVPASKRVFFRVTERNWASDIRKAQERIQAQADRDGSFSASFVESTNGLRGSKRRKLEVIPSVTTSAVTGSERLGDTTLIMTHVTPAEQIRSFEELLDNLERLELPGQIASVLKSPVLQQSIACFQEDHITQRLGFWLSETLHEEILDQPRMNRARGERFLNLVIHFTEFLQEGIPACENFLVRYLHTWNGSDYRPQILRLISRFRLYDFPIYCKCQIVHTCTLMLRNFVAVEIPRCKGEADNNNGGENTEGEKSSMSMFVTEAEEFDYYRTLEKFIHLVDKLAVVGLMVEKDHVLFFHYVLTFYELVSELRSVYKTPFVSIPSPGIVYRALLSSNAVVVSRMCNIVCKYPKEFRSWKSASSEADIWQGTRSMIAPFNQYILEISNILWRSKAFVESQVMSEPFLSVIPKPVVSRTLVDHANDGLSILRHVALIGYVHQFLRETQPETKKLHPNLIKSKEKDLYLKFLKSNRLDGILAFINTYIKRTTSEK